MSLFAMTVCFLGKQKYIKIPSFKFALKTTLGKRILPSPMSFLLIRTVVGQILFDASFVFRCMMLIVGTPSIVFISPYYPFISDG